jgi:hypothetical protein
MPMPSLEGSNLRPLWRFRHPLNKQKVKRGGWPTKKMLLNYDRRRNVYENKENHGKLYLEKSDIYVEVTRILQRIADLEGQFAANDAFWCGNLVIK